MASHSATVALLLVLAGLASSPAAAFNITRLLGEFSDFSTFNNLLSQTKLAEEINRRQTITVLTVDNGAAGGISSLPSDVQRKVLSMHVVLDYYDTAKLGAIKNHTTLLTTMFQSSGKAIDRMGFLNFTKRSDGVMVFGSAQPGAPKNSEMVKSVASRPYNISVLQVSTPIVPPGVGGSADSGAPPPHKATAPAPAPATKGAPPAKDEEASAPAPSDDDTGADAPADAPGPAADGPEADGPATDGPTVDGPAADAPAHKKSSDDAADAPEGSAAGRVVASAGLIGIVALLMTVI
ncbi:Fasciclin-like arabinogalactan protein 14 [Dichanthelium oligosanthes]|uniref:Fasciclin-like arabinogalactan protein 14 n=1 Tax=Dichanthelium oligosanthes TaxID=888268 RepID=A0A1E5UWE3_9POAL|nr:Fasciclin-like arabinogalactan protein 14 [Dichanthelium oligosanthes]